MTIDLSKLTTIQIEWGSQVMSNQADTMIVTRLMSIMLADTKTLLGARKNPDLLEPFIEQAASIPYEESLEAAEGFFERWRTFQMRILRSAAGPEAEIPEVTKPPILTMNAPALAAATATP
jgi:hypothetical protein